MRKSSMPELYRNAIVILLVIAGFGSIYFAYKAVYLGIVDRVLFPIAVLLLIGVVVSWLKSYRSMFVFYLVGGKHGIATMDRLAKRWHHFWHAMAEWGLALGFGLLTYKLVKGNIDKRVMALALVSIFLMLAFVVPLMNNALYFINLPQIQSRLTYAPGLVYSSIWPYLQNALGLNGSLYGIIALVTILTGFTGFILVLLAISGFSILNGTLQFLFTVRAGHPQVGILTSQIPGAAPVIPGIFIPLIPGIIALAILLIIHEASHGVLARMAKVKLLSTGLVVFGVIPIGGFVEPDERQIDKLRPKVQTSIMSAGIAANFLAALVFFIPMLLIIIAVPHLYVTQFTITNVTKGYPAYNVLQPGSNIISWNGRNITDYNSLVVATSQNKPGKTTTLTTSTGTYTLIAVKSPTNSSKGIIGVDIAQRFVPGVTQNAGGKLLFFFYTLFALLVMLNFFVAVFNLLPLPGLDGWRIYRANLKNREHIIKILIAVIGILIIINVLPLFYALA